MWEKVQSVDRDVRDVEKIYFANSFYKKPQDYLRQ